MGDFGNICAVLNELLSTTREGVDKWPAYNQFRN